MPNPYNPLDWDRYSYTRNNPVNAIDPSGHKACSNDGNSFDSCQDPLKRTLKEIANDYGITFSGGSNLQHVSVVVAAIQAGNKLQEFIPNSSSASAFRSVFTNGVNYVFDPRCDGCRRGTKDDGTKCGGDFESHGCTAAGGFTSGYTITFASMSGQSSNNSDRMIKNAVHELGHSYYYRIGGPSINGLSREALIANSPDSIYDWQQHPPSMNVGGVDMPGELFADSFLAWTLGGWNTDNRKSVVDAVNLAQNTMDSYVP